LLFKPERIDGRLWSSFLSKLEELSVREEVSHDICLIGSYARGDASPISDLDFVLFSMGGSKLKHTEVFHVNDKMATIFPVNVYRLLKAVSVDFYNANNPFEAKLVYGRGETLGMLRRELRGRRIDLNATKRVIGETLSNRLMTALSDTILDYGEGIRDLRVCLAKLNLYAELFDKKTDPWLIIPYHYSPADELGNLLNNLYYSEDYEELSAKLTNLNLKSLLASFEHHGGLIKTAERMVEEAGFAGKYVENYVKLYLLVEEKVRSALWSKLPKRWEIERLHINHLHTNIACRNEKVWWYISIGKGENLKIETYGTNKF